MPRNVLLLTATITPLAGIPLLARTDPKLRLQDYKTALSFYINQLGSCFDAIIFAENSNSDISSLRSLVANKQSLDQVEFISFYGLDYLPSYGRGYGEFRLIDYAIVNSKLITNDDVVWKVTGRYVIENICELVASRPANADIYCHMRNYPNRLCELYLLAWTRRGYEALIRGVYPKLKNDMVDGRVIVEETLFRKVADDAGQEKIVIPRFKVNPIIHGIRGWNNAEYSKKWSFKGFTRRLASRIIPGLWI